MAPIVLVLNGPNLNLLGLREPEVYGRETFAYVETLCRDVAGDLGIEADVRQTNHEGVLVDWIQEARGRASGLVINPGAYTHTSIAIPDALRAVGLPTIELHLSNVFARESFRRHSHVSPVARAVMCGCGVRGYEWAIRALAAMLRA